jgi:hypothetical protein
MGFILRRVTKSRLFPAIAIVPVAVASSLITLGAFTLARVGKVNRTLQDLLESQKPKTA